MVRSSRKRDGEGAIPLLVIPGLSENTAVTEVRIVPRTDTGVPR